MVRVARPRRVLRRRLGPHGVPVLCRTGPGLGQETAEAQAQVRRAPPPLSGLPIRGDVARPKVLLNCACSLDGKMAAPDGQSLPLSDEADWRRVHHLRSTADAILVGIGTILKDDPALRIKEELAPISPTRKLLRVVLDARGRTPKTARVVDGTTPTLILHGPGVRANWPHADHAEVPVDEQGHIQLEPALDLLHRRGVRILMVEGGAQVLRAFLNSTLVDQWTLYVAPVLVGGTGPSIFDGRPSMIGRRLHVENVEPRGKGVLWTLRP
jgi:riboflavin-specific deaminase-like protein